MLTATQSLEKIRKSFESIDKGKTQTFPEAASDGDFFRQGDLYVWKRTKLPEGITKEIKNLQLAEGNTQGSRHILDSNQGVKIYRVKEGDALQGPWLHVLQERTITHPEHGNILLCPGVYEITYQRAFAEELKRVVD